MHEKKDQTESQPDASVFDEKLQPVVVRVHGFGLETETAVTQRKLVEHVRPRAEPRIEREHRRHGEEPKLFPVFVETEFGQSKTHGKTFGPGRESQCERKRHEQQRAGRQPSAMAMRPAAHNEKAQQGESRQAGWNAQISRTREAERQADKARGRNPQEQHFHRGPAATPDKQTQREKSSGLERSRQSGATGERSRKPTGAPSRRVAARQRHMPGQVGPRMERFFGGELRDGEQ